MTKIIPYRGRFAPSPTGPLHFGSLIAAIGSYLQAKTHDGEWLIRIDDIDPPRELEGASENILRTLEDFGFEWDQEVIYQSKRLKRYQESIERLIKLNLAYPCTCSRTQIMNKTSQNKGNLIYPGYCRTASHTMNIDSASPVEHSIRLRCNDETVSFSDYIQGRQASNIEKDIGDFVIKRRDHCFSYQLASGVDDAEQGITEVIRGSDLLKCTFGQRYIQQLLNLTSPTYCHLPVAINHTGQKLSKQNHAAPILAKDAVSLLYKALKFLGQMPPIELIKANQEDIWCWAKTHWRLDLVPKVSQQSID